jgi:RNA recognition motif-containing protein
LPWGFHEHQLREFLQQFGTISRLKLARSRHSGNSRHFAFVEFEDAEVAAIVAETMNGYMLYGRTLQCAVVPPERVHKRMLEQSKNRQRKIDWAKANAQRANAPKTEEQHASRLSRLQRRDAARRVKLEQAGIDYQFDGYQTAAIDGEAEAKQTKRGAKAARGDKAPKMETENGNDTATASTGSSSTKQAQSNRNKVQRKQKQDESADDNAMQLESTTTPAKAAASDAAGVKGAATKKTAASQSRESSAAAPTSGKKSGAGADRSAAKSAAAAGKGENAAPAKRGKKANK